MYKIQCKEHNSKVWDEICPESFSIEDVQDWFNDLVEDYGDGFEYRAVSLDGSEIIKFKVVSESTGTNWNTLSRFASPEVHARNEEFFSKYL